MAHLILQNKIDLLPFVVSLGGILADYFSTRVGLGLGFCETHATYSPAYALLVFWGAIVFLVILLPREKPWRLSINGLALLSYLGVLNNILVIVGLFPGLAI